MITTEQIIQDLTNVRNKINKIPTKKEYKQFGIYNPETISKKFLSWNNAILYCFNKVARMSPSIKIMHNCIVCNKETKNPKFCSNSCAAKINNSIFPKHPRKKCIACQKEIRSTTSYCKQCHTFNIITKFGERRIKDFTSTYARHKYQAIRNHAHKVANFYNIKKECPICDYKNHLQLCHIKDIGKFDKNTILNVVNDPKNLIYLCPNHHWDLDHGLLTL